MSRKLTILAVFGILFVLVLIPSLSVPMLSDDFAYYTVGTDFSGQILHYMGWSGRIVSNSLSSYQLNLLPHAVLESVASLVFVLLIFFIVRIPYSFGGKDVKGMAFSAVLIFTLYWVANPALGETSFWIVGTTNYLWPSMFVAGYFLYVFESTNRAFTKKDIILALVFGFFAGCSNENTSIVVIVISLLLLFIERSKVTLVGIVGVLVGAAVLILSPGNRVRARVFTDWNALTYPEKFDLHFFDRLPGLLSIYWQVYLVAILTLFVLGFCGFVNKKKALWGGVFFLGSLMATAVFVASPYIPPRAGNGAFVLLLISLSFMVSALFDADLGKLKKFYVTAVLLFVGLYFVPSYYLFNEAAKRIWAQSVIREEIIAEAKSQGAREIEVPGYYYTRMSKPGEALSAFENSSANMFYGIDKLSVSPAKFDYSRMGTLPKVDVDITVAPDLKVKALYAYEEKFSNNKALLLDLDGDVAGLFATGAAIYVHVYTKDGAYFNCDTAISFKYPKGYNLAVATCAADYRNIDRIGIGAYRASTLISANQVSKPVFVAP